VKACFGMNFQGIMNHLFDSKWQEILPGDIVHVRHLGSSYMDFDQRALVVKVIPASSSSVVAQLLANGKLFVSNPLDRLTIIQKGDHERRRV